MWFAALGSGGTGNPWLIVLAQRLFDAESARNLAPLFDASFDEYLHRFPVQKIRFTRRRYRYETDTSSTDYWRHEGEPSDYLTEVGGDGELSKDKLESLVRPPPQYDSDVENLIAPIQLSRFATSLCIRAPWIVLALAVLLNVRFDRNVQSPTRRKIEKVSKEKKDQ